MMRQFNNPFIKHKYTCDPTAIIHEDTVYLYTGHDEAEPGTEDYVMNNWLCFSTQDMVHWTEHPSPLKAKDFSWSSGGAFATKVFQHNSKFYWFVAVQDADGKAAIGVAAATSPTGPFTDLIGAPLVSHDMLPQNDNMKANLDPSVIIGEDGHSYLFWGNGNCYFARLTDDLTKIASAITILDLPEFEEGVHLHKRNDWYYLSYGYGMPETVAYAMSKSIHGPWEYKGILNEIAGNCETNRPCIITFKGKDFFIYHNGALKNGGSHRRSVCADYLYYNNDETLKRVVMTSEGIM